MKTLVVVCSLCLGRVYSLIGLRPKDQWPHHGTTRKPPQLQTVATKSPVSNQLHSPYELPKYLNASDLETESQNFNTCQTLTLLSCSSNFLKQIMHNTSPPCADIQHFTDCIIDSLRKHGRKDFVTALVVLDEFYDRVKCVLRCVGNDTKPILPHLRHSLSKRYGDTCCTEDILHCTIETFFKINFNRNERCSLINFYDVCMNEAAKHCESISKHYPMFVSQLKRSCFVTSARKRRSTMFKQMFVT